MTIRAKVLVEGEPGTLEVIAAALRRAGLSSIEVGLTPRCPDVTRFPHAPGGWAALADVAPGLAYADWRTEVLSLAGTADSGPLRTASARPGPGVTPLRPAV